MYTFGRCCASTLLIYMKNLNTTAGYSGTPLSKKLGIKEGIKILAVNIPENYFDLLHPLPENILFLSKIENEIDIIHLFTSSQKELEKLLLKYKSRIKQNGTIWVSWHKKSSKINTEITEDIIREIALPKGLVDIKVCAVDETWSGLKLVIRKENRK